MILFSKLFSVPRSKRKAGITMHNQRRAHLNASPDYSTETTGYTHILCGAYAPAARFDEEESVSIRSRDPRTLVRCPECLVATELRSFLPTNKKCKD
jgi:hypothetical protein